MNIKFWGVRGSIATPERRNSKYGGNTPCIEVRLDDGTLIILDCGTGFRSLGKSLLREFGERPIHGYIFLTHFHWDHIQGIPFFQPFYRKGNIFLVHCVMRNTSDLEATIQDQMMNPYFPVGMSAMGSARHFFELSHHPITVSNAIVSSATLNHPQGCVAYSIEADGRKFVLATDNEPGSSEHDKILRKFCEGADVLVYDAQYTPEQLRAEKKGWGHSSWLEGTEIAREAGVGNLILFHHDPDNDDAFLDGLVEKARQEFPHTQAAAEGMIINSSKERLFINGPGSHIERREEHRYAMEVPVRLAWRDRAGTTAHTEGITRDVSKSGIRFIAPAEIETGEILEMEMRLPNEVTHHGEQAFSFMALPLRQAEANGALGKHRASIAVAARLLLRD